MKDLLMSCKAGGGKSPQCRVCGDESSGFHYGVDSCEGCKGFFRRCVTQGMHHKCANDNRCEITPFTRNSCQACRFMKCYEVGMSREASRLGRRPKRLKEVSGETSRSHSGNLPIAPYPSPQELMKIKMAELKKMLASQENQNSELLQAQLQEYLDAAAKSFREHAKSTTHSNTSHSHHQVTISHATPVVNAPKVTSPPLSADVNLNADLTMFNAKNYQNFDMPIGSPSSMQAPSPFLVPDLSMSDFSPLTPGGTNLNTEIFDNKLFMHQGASNLNGNSNVYSPSTQTITDNMPSPLNMPPLDNLDPCSPSTFMAFNTNQMASPDSSSLDMTNNTINLNNNPMSGANYNANVETTDNLNNLNRNTNIMSPGSIKQEVDPVIICDNANANTSFQVKQEPDDEDEFNVLNSQENLDKVESIMTEMNQTPNNDRLLLIDQVTDALVEAHMATCDQTRIRVKQAFERLSDSKPADMPDMSQLTIDAPLVWQKFLSSMVPEISKVVKFGKKLPGFVEVGEDDQIKLIKQGSFEVMLVRQSIMINCKNETMLDPTLSMATPRSVIQQLPMGEFLDEVFMIARHLQPLELSDSELGMLGAILLICPERDNLSNVVAIRTIQQLYHQALYIMMKCSHRDTYDERFRNLMKLIPLFKKVNNDHSKHLNDIKMRSPQAFNAQFPALHKEVFNSSTS